jgi:MFS family permease
MIGTRPREGAASLLERPVPRPLDRASLVLTVALAFSQDAAYGLVFLSYMNHYLLDVLHTSPGLPGYTLALYGGTKLVMHPIAGRVLDRTSPRFVFLGAVGLQVAAAGVLLVSHTLAAFLIASSLLALGSAALWPLIYETVARTQPAEVRSRVTGALSLAGYVATGSGFATGVLLGHFTHSRHAAFFVLLALVGLPILFAARPSLAGTGRAPRLADVDEPAGPARASRFSGIALFGVIVFIDYAGITSLAGAYGPYVRLTLHITLLHTSLLLAPAALMALVSLGIAARYSRPHRRLGEMALLYVLAAAGAFGLAATSTPWVAGVFAVVLAAGAGGIGPIIAASMIDQGGDVNRGLILGTLMSLEGLGSVLGPAGIALVIDLINPAAGLAAIGVIFAMLVPLTYVAFRRGSSTAPRPAQLANS